jgi:hypothetical protein
VNLTKLIVAQISWNSPPFLEPEDLTEFSHQTSYYPFLRRHLLLSRASELFQSSVSTTRVTEAWLNTDLSPAKNLVSFSPAAKLYIFNRKVSKGWPPIAKQASNLQKCFLTRDGVHAFKYLHFLLEQCFSVLAYTVGDRLTNSSDNELTGQQTLSRRIFVFGQRTPLSILRGAANRVVCWARDLNGFFFPFLTRTHYTLITEAQNTRRVKSRSLLSKGFECFFPFHTRTHDTVTLP